MKHHWNKIAWQENIALVLRYKLRTLILMTICCMAPPSITLSINSHTMTQLSCFYRILFHGLTLAINKRSSNGHPGTIWYTLVHPGTLWYTLVHSETPWYTLGTPKCTLMHPDTPWYTLVHPGTRWYTLLHSSTPWYTLVHPGTPWYTLVNPGTPWYTLLHSSTPRYTLAHHVL